MFLRATLAVLLVSLMLIPQVPTNAEGVRAPADGAAPDLASPFASFRFVRNSQNVEENRLNDLRDIYYYVSILDATGSMSSLTAVEKADIITTVHSFQNADGGFGDWYNDRSKSLSTRMALEVLRLLGDSPPDPPAVSRFLERLQVTGLPYGNYGFRSSLKEFDADVSSTFDAVMAYASLDGQAPNATQVDFYLRDHQNFDGGFGYQTNRQSGIFWESTASHTYRGLEALDTVNGTPDFSSEALSFLKGLQRTDGGFANRPNETSRVAYTYDAVLAFSALGEPVPNKADIISFIESNQLPGGGFIEYSLDNKAGLHSTFFAVKTLNMLGADYDKSAPVAFADEFLAEREDGGYGDYPGFDSNVRFTFDAVSALNLIGRTPVDREGVVSFIDGMRNDDGGYGHGGDSNVETTYRSVLSLQYMAEPITAPGAVVSYVRSTQNNDGGFGFADGYVSRGSYTYRAVRTLEILGASPLNTDGAVSFLQSLENSDGGFGNYFGEEDSDLGSTYRAVRALSILGSAPDDPDRTEDFILASQNPDGGFRRSPGDDTAPSNFSKAIFTYDAVLALHFIDRPLGDRQPVYGFLLSLRNPDLGFGPQPDHTSTVSSTFTSLWAYFYLYPDYFNHAPILTNGTAIPQEADSRTTIHFAVDYEDQEGQAPEYVHLLLDGVRHFLPAHNGTCDAYCQGFTLPVGNHTFHFEASDGFQTIATPESWVNILPSGEPPQLNISVHPMEGTADTEFTITVTYSDAEGDPAQFVSVQFDDVLWWEMNSTGGDVYTITTTMLAGVHNVRARASDGANLVYSDTVFGPLVHADDPSRPDWDTFLRIEELIADEKGVDIAYLDVERDTLDGKLVWRVDLDDGPVYVNNDGTEIIDGDEVDDGQGIILLMVLLLVVIVVVFITLLVMLRMKRQRQLQAREDERGGDGGSEKNTGGGGDNEKRE